MFHGLRLTFYTKIFCSVFLLHQIFVPAAFAFNLNESSVHLQVYNDGRNIESAIHKKKYIIKLKSEITNQGTLRNLMKEKKSRNALENGLYSVVELNENEYKEIKKNKDVEYIEEDQEISLLESSSVFESTYEVNNLEQTSWGYDLLYNKEMDPTKKHNTIKIAILDTGVDASHEDLKISGSINFTDQTIQDENGHGTKVTGVINSQANGFGIKGLAPSAEIYSIKIMDSQGRGTVSSAISAIDWAIENNIQILNMSFGSARPSYALHEALNRARSHNILLIGAAGNNGSKSAVFPANYPIVLSVASIDKQLNFTSFSSFGKVDLVSPGADILTTDLKNTYTYASGTSVSAAFVTATAALVWSYHKEWNADDVRLALLNSADSINSKLSGYGVVNPLDAIRSNSKRTITLNSDGAVTDSVYGTGDKIEILSTHAYASASQIDVGETSRIYFRYDDKPHDTKIDIYLNGVNVKPKAAVLFDVQDGFWDFTADKPGDYKIRITPIDSPDYFEEVRVRVEIRNKTVIIVPGIAATGIKENKDSGSFVWKPNVKSLAYDFEQLALNDNGIPKHPLFIDEPLREYYGTLKDDLSRSGFDVVYFGYDFRLDNSITAQQLEERINEVLSSRGIDKVSIVAHSMGGLVATKYIANGNSSKVDKLITLGTPFLGSPKSVYTLQTGRFLDDFRDLVLKKYLKPLALNMQSIYQLIPNESYFLYNNTHYLKAKYFNNWYEKDVTAPQESYQDTKYFLANSVAGFKKGLLNIAENYHYSFELVKSLNAVDSYQIIGENKATIGEIITSYQKKNGLYVQSGKVDINPVNGDGTVPIISANIGNLLNKNAYYVRAEHSNIPSNYSARNAVKNILLNKKDSIQLPRVPKSSRKFKLKIECPVDLHVYDSLGNHMGRTKGEEYAEDIESGSYFESDDMKIAFLNKDNYNLVLKGTGEGEMTYTLQEWDEADKLVKTIRFDNVAIHPTTQITSNTNLDDQIVLKVDNEGDGIVDTIITPSAILNDIQSTDQEPPLVDLKLQGSLGSNSWYNSDVAIDLSASDKNSGISKILYSFDDSEPNQYTSILKLHRDGIYNLRSVAVDKNTNKSELLSKEIKIDKTSPESPVINNYQTEQGMKINLIHGSDSGSGVLKSQYKIGGSSWTDFPEQLVLKDEGDYKLFARTIDVAGNISKESAISFTINPSRPGKPIVKLSNTEWTSSKVLVALIPPDTLQEVYKLQYKIGNEGSWKDYTNEIPINVEGVTPIYARASNAAGVTSEEAVGHVKIDRTPPTNPGNLTVINKTSTSATIKWSPSTDTSYVKGYEIYKNGAQVGYTASENYSLTGLTSNQNYTVLIKARDGAGNVSSGSVIKITIN
ncbi:S8 family serine peptidase [Paenibacillus chitinolyticus]|uniref:alpha/beta fold hydrolase n=1 Tax=Paenibacillus chitinolyticus TaxID=79263 RepID=UPI002DB6E8CF|nr:alpha/beta fold hydrolase [Paenibacillus chitinolyticus]MEC0248475.1 S8 family serine peptidase [Paenibacillus chitinolyticus]